MLRSYSKNMTMWGPLIPGVLGSNGGVQLLIHVPISASFLRRAICGFLAETFVWCSVAIICWLNPPFCVTPFSEMAEWPNLKLPVIVCYMLTRSPCLAPVKGDEDTLCSVSCGAASYPQLLSFKVWLLGWAMEGNLQALKEAAIMRGVLFQSKWFPT